MSQSDKNQLAQVSPAHNSENESKQLIQNANKPLAVNTCFLYGITLTVTLCTLQFGMIVGILSLNLKTLAVKYAWTESEQTIFFSVASSISSVGAVFGAFGGKKLISYGRWRTLIILNVFCLIGGGLTLIQNIYCLILGRFIQGMFGCGVSSVAGPRFIQEIAPIHLTARLGGITQFSIIFGLVITSFMGLYVPTEYNEMLESEYWRIQFAVLPLVGLLQIILLLTVFNYETPEGSLTCLKNENAYQKVVRRVYREPDVEEALKSLRPIKDGSSATGTFSQALCDPRYRRATWNGIILCAFLQYSGISAVFSYSGIFFADTGIIDAGLGGLLHAVAHLVGTFIFLVIVQHIGRKTLLIFGHFFAAVGLILMGTGVTQEISALVVTGIGIFGIAMEISSASMGYVVVAETCNDAGLSLSIFSLWLFTVTTVAHTPFMIASDDFGPAATFFFYAALLFVSVIFVALSFKETRGLSAKECRQVYWTQAMKDQANSSETEMVASVDQNNNINASQELKSDQQ